MPIKILIPDLKGKIGPCFSAATRFEIITVDSGQVVSRNKVSCAEEGGFRRIRLIRIHDIDVLICNGIDGFYTDMMNSMNLKLFAGISMPVDEAIAKYLDGSLKSLTQKPRASSSPHNVPLDELIGWARMVFSNNGYRVKPGPGQDSFLIDLVAETKCPICNKPIKVAICCGAHTYRIDQEIREFHFSAKNEYNARVFISPYDESAHRSCREYNIEYLSFNPQLSNLPKDEDQPVPLLQGPVMGHAKLNVTDNR